MDEIIKFIDRIKEVFDLLSDEEIDLYNEIYNDRPTKEFVEWINKKYHELKKN